MAGQPKRIKPARFTWEIPGNLNAKIVLNAKLHRMKDIMMQNLNRPLNNYDALDSLLDFWFEKKFPEIEEQNIGYTSFHQIETDEDEKLLVTTN